MELLAMADLRSEQNLREAGLTPESIQFYLDSRFQYLELTDAYREALESKDFRKQLDIEEQLPVLEATLKSYGLHPRDVPLDTIKTLAHAPLSDDPIEQRYKERIKNPATAMRAFCMNCQGGSTTAVSECASVSCPLWIFRQGTNPLYGRTLPPAEHIEIEGDDIEEIDETADGGDAE